MASKVNIDALIPREDFEVSDPNLSTVSTSPTTVTIRDFEENSFLYPRLRKPDFQRETAEWDSKRVCDFIESFLNGDLIPAIILWDSGSYLFVIDGARRLSALIAWVHDDYGDNTLSRNFFEHIIPEEQLKVADRTRRLIKRQLGSYEDHQFAIKHPDRQKPAIVERANRLASLAIQLQWVKGDASKAETSFFNINQKAAPINKTELKLLKARNQPNALAARAIIRAGKGHKYWSKFAAENVQVIETEAKEINNILFLPPINRPIKTTHLPIAGQNYSSQALPLVFDLVNLANNVQIEKDIQLDNDSDGEKTIRFLKNTRKIAQRISGIHPSSLGLHPALYFYSPTGRHQTVSFLAIVLLLKEFEKHNYYKIFTLIRPSFEEFLLDHRSFPSQVNIKYRGGYNGAKGLQELYMLILKCLQQGVDIIEIIKANEQFAFLNLEQDVTPASVRQKDFSSGTKSAAYLREALIKELRCEICKGLIYSGSISIDHKIRKQDGGLGTIDNAQLTHPYCNSSYKN